MLRIKFFAVALVLGLTGAVYAAGRTQDASAQDHSAHAAGKTPACCQAKHGKAEQKEGQPAASMSCDHQGGSCCKGHAAHAGQSAEGEDCCAGGSCCAGHEKKAGAAAAVVKTSAGQEEAKSCCAGGGSCCKEGAECCKGHAAAAQTAGEKREGCCACCADSCPTHAWR